MRPVSNRRSKTILTAANDNRPSRKRIGAVAEWPSRPSAEPNGAVPEWLLRSLMVLACSAPIAALLYVLPWIRQLLDG